MVVAASDHEYMVVPGWDVANHWYKSSNVLVTFLDFASIF